MMMAMMTMMVTMMMMTRLPVPLTITGSTSVAISTPTAAALSQVTFTKGAPLTFHPTLLLKGCMLFILFAVRAITVSVLLNAFVFL